MPYRAGVIGPDEARLYAIQSLIQGKIADLQTDISLEPILMPAGTATNSNVIVGDPDIFESNLAFIICITGGGKADGTDWTQAWRFVGLPATVSSYENVLFTQIRAYIHPNAFLNSIGSGTDWPSVSKQALWREILLSRIAGFLRGDCFNTLAGVDINLQSIEYHPATTVTVGATSATQQVASTADWGATGTGGGQVLWFETAQQFATISSVVDATHVLLTAPITTTTAEVVAKADNTTRGVVSRIEKGNYERNFGANMICRGLTLTVQHVLN